MSDQYSQELPHRRWRDDPITTVSEDRLERAPVAQRAARLIAENHTPHSSVVYGLEGPWGSGKTSVIALLTTYLTEDRSSGDEWRVVSFTPWATTGTEGLLSEFFAALSTIAPEKSGDKVRNLIASYADIARPFVSLIPLAGSAVVEASRTLEHRLAKPWNVAFEDLATELRKLHTPVLVVVDGIDRLQPTELLDLLKVVRLLGRFPGWTSCWPTTNRRWSGLSKALVMAAHRRHEHAPLWRRSCSIRSAFRLCSQARSCGHCPRDSRIS